MRTKYNSILLAPEPATQEASAVAALTSAVTQPLNADGEVSIPASPSAPATPVAPAATPEPATTAPVAEKLSFGDDFPTLETTPKKPLAPTSKAETPTPVEPQAPTEPEPTAPPAEPKPGEQVQTQQQQQAQRDYSIFPEDLQAALKKAPNSVFDAVKAYTLKQKEVAAEVEKLRKGALPESYLEHPQAYQFDRTYQAAVSQLNQATFEQNHLVDQLGKLKGGADTIKVLEGYHPESGQPVFRDMKVTAEQAPAIEARISAELTNLAQIGQQARQQAVYVQQSFTQQHGQTVQYLRNAEAKFFPDLQDMSKHPRKSDYEFFTKEFLPPQMRGHVMASGLGKAYVTILNLQDTVAKQAKELETLKRTSAAAALAGPSPSQISGAAPAGKPPITPTTKGELSLSMFPIGD